MSAGAPGQPQGFRAPALRDSIVVGLAVALAALPLRQVTEDQRFVPTVITVVAVLQLIAAGARALWQLAWVPTLVQLAALGAGAWAAAGLQTGIAQGRTPWEPVVQVAQAATHHIITQPSPMSADDATLIVLTTAVGAMCVLVDLCFVVGRSAVLAVVPLAGGYLAAAAVNTRTMWPVSMIALCTAWLLLLTAHTVDQDRRWPRGLAHDTGARRRAGAFGLHALQLGAPAVALALVAGLALPSAGARSWWPPGSDKTVQLVDPSIDLSQNLRQPDDRTLLRYTTTAAGGVYLRSSTLTTVNESGWAQADMGIQQGFPSHTPGVSGSSPVVQTQVSIGDFASVYLPVPYAPSSWTAPGHWGYDPVSLTVLNTDRRLGAEATRGLTYSVQSLVVDPTPQQLSTAVAGIPPEGNASMQVPDGVPDGITALARQITAQARTDGQRAVALQDWLHDPSRFTYDVNAPEGTGYGVLVDFLLGSRSGYCVHFAAAMALMARILGIASRVAVGFTPGQQQADGSWVVSAHDMHAWPELYFSGIGWVRFEPTVSIGIDPNWTRLPPQPGSQPTTTFPSAPAAQTPTSVPTVTPTAPGSVASTPVVPGKKPADYGWLWWIGAVLALLAAPGLIRIAARSRRMAGGPDPSRRIGGAWRELHATAIDLRLGWPDGTPHHVATTLAPTLDDAGQAALNRVAVLEERARYSPGVPHDAAVAHDVACVTRQWRERASVWTNTWARIMPRSLVAYPLTRRG